MKSDYLFISGLFASTPLPNLQRISHPHLQKRYRYDFNDLDAIDHFYENIVLRFKEELESLDIDEVVMDIMFKDKYDQDEDNEVLKIITSTWQDYSIIKEEKINKEEINTDILEKYKLKKEDTYFYGMEQFLYHQLVEYLSDGDSVNSTLAYIYIRLFSYRYIRAYLKSKVLEVDMPYVI